MRAHHTLGLLAALAVLLVGCSKVPEGTATAEPLVCPPGTEGCDSIRPVGPGGDLTIDMDSFFFDVVDGVAVTGEVLVTAVNLSDVYHNVEFLGAAEGSAIPEAEGGETGTGTVLLFPGEWTVICNVPGHRAAGMETTVTIYATAEEAARAEAESMPSGG